MASKYIITAEQLKEIEEARKSNKNKRVEAKLKALAMRGEGASAKKISEATGFHPAHISTLVSKYIHQGLDSIVHSHYGGNRRNIWASQQTVRPYFPSKKRG